VGLTAHAISCGADKEVEVGACVGLLDVVDVEPLPAARRIGEAREGGGVGSAAQQLLLDTSSVKVRPGASRVISSPVCTSASGRSLGAT
jgi:hypothetical protein